MFHRFLNSRFKCMVGTSPPEERSRDRMKIGVDCRSTAHRRREYISLGNLCWYHDIHVIDPDWQVHTIRAHVTEQRGHAWQHFALHIQVPLHNVIAMGMLLNEVAEFGRRTDTCECSRVERILETIIVIRDRST